MKYAISNDIKMRTAALEWPNMFNLPDFQVFPAQGHWRAKIPPQPQYLHGELHLNGVLDMGEKADKPSVRILYHREKAAYEINQIIGSGDDPFVKEHRWTSQLCKRR